MSLTTTEQILASIQHSPAGTPATVTVDSRTYRIVAEPLRYFERIDRWWQTPGIRAPRGTGKGVIDQEILRLEVQLGSKNSQIISMELARQTDGSWAVRDILRAA